MIAALSLPFLFAILAFVLPDFSALSLPSLFSIFAFVLLIKIQSLQCMVKIFPNIGELRHMVDDIRNMIDDTWTSFTEGRIVKYAAKTSIHHEFASDIDLRCLDLLGPSFGNPNFKPHSSSLIIDSLDEFLRLRSDSKIKSLKLSFCLTNSVAKQFEQCFYSLGKLGVEELDLKCCCQRDWELSIRGICILSNNLSFYCHLLPKIPSLKSFKLSYCFLRPSLRSQSSNNNSLQTLDLSNVAVFPGAIECILSNCLRVESLTICGCNCPSKLRFCGPDLELKSLYICNCAGVEEIELYASNLVMLDFCNQEMVNFMFDHAPKLQSLHIDVTRKDILPYVFGKLAKDLPHLKSLSFSASGDNFQVSSINMFDNLRKLDFSLSYKQECDLLSLTALLQRCPLLQELHIIIYKNDGPPPEARKQPVVFNSELKIVEISGFMGTENEIEFALYILKSAIGLQKMQITSGVNVYNGHGRWSEETKRTIRRRLQGGAVSKTAQVIIQHEAHMYEWIHSQEDCYNDV